MTKAPSAAASGQVRVGGDITVNRLGFGAMRITGKGIWGEPADPARRGGRCGACPSSASISSTPPTATGRMSART